MAKTTAQILAELPAEEANTLREWLIEMDQGRRTIASLKIEVEQLRAIVDKLPKTADGVPVVPGPRTLWEWCSLRSEAREVRPVNPAYQNEGIDFSGYYSTREAAEAAKGGARCVPG